MCNDLFARRHLFKSVQTYHRKHLLSTGGCRVCTDSQNIYATGYKLAKKPVLNTKQKTRDPWEKTKSNRALFPTNCWGNSGNATLSFLSLRLFPVGLYWYTVARWEKKMITNTTTKIPLDRMGHRIFCLFVFKNVLCQVQVPYMNQMVSSWTKGLFQPEWFSDADYMWHTNLIYQSLLQSIFLHMWEDPNTCSISIWSSYSQVSATLIRCFSLTSWAWRECCCHSSEQWPDMQPNSCTVQVQSSVHDFLINMKIVLLPRYIRLIPLFC